MTYIMTEPAGGQCVMEDKSGLRIFHINNERHVNITSLRRSRPLYDIKNPWSLPRLSPVSSSTCLETT